MIGQFESPTSNQVMGCKVENTWKQKNREVVALNFSVPTSVW